MKLSRLISYLNHLDASHTHIQQAAAQVAQQIDPVLHVIKTHDIQFADITQQLQTHRSSIENEISSIDQGIQNLKREIYNSIEGLETHYLSQSYQLYHEGMCHDSHQHMLERRFSIDASTESYLRARLLRHSDWHYPGMIIRPGLESWIDHLVALDPLYLVDIDPAMLEPSRARFSEAYRNRLRSCFIQETTEGTMLHQLPQQQMGLVLVYNYFHYKPLELVRQFVQEIYNCLRPGGTLIFTFNNCDRGGAVELAERYFMCYTPGRLVLAAAELIGFETSHIYHIDAAATWVELVKPGQLHSNRGGQALARIIAKT
jgi:SAM-dependent methyltransferase